MVVCARMVICIDPYSTDECRFCISVSNELYGSLLPNFICNNISILFICLFLPLFPFKTLPPFLQSDNNYFKSVMNQT